MIINIWILYRGPNIFYLLALIRPTKFNHGPYYRLISCIKVFFSITCFTLLLRCYACMMLCSTHVIYYIGCDMTSSQASYSLVFSLERLPKLQCNFIDLLKAIYVSDLCEAMHLSCVAICQKCAASNLYRHTFYIRTHTFYLRSNLGLLPSPDTPHSFLFRFF